jgi:plasmid stabilization system protein ParE
MRLIYHPEAEAELIGAAEYYEHRLPGLGAQLLDAVDRAVRSIEGAPERSALVAPEIRRYLMPRFPYAIYYRATPDQLRILAFKHHSLRSGYWHHRLPD